MKLTKKIKYSAIVLTAISLTAVAQMNHSAMAEQGMNHTQHMAMMNTDSNHQPTQAALTEAGTDPFATMQEVIAKLEANPDTNWEKVNMEALRLHLVQMQDMVLNVEVAQVLIKNGFQAMVTPTTPRALESLTKVLSAHPAQMQAETGWHMQVANNDGVFTLEVTTNKPQEVAKIQGLGYIGVMAYGNHHQPHHWAMASGNNPHAGHDMQH